MSWKLNMAGKTGGKKESYLKSINDLTLKVVQDQWKCDKQLEASNKRPKTIYQICNVLTQWKKIRLPAFFQRMRIRFQDLSWQKCSIWCCYSYCWLDMVILPSNCFKLNALDSKHPLKFYYVVLHNYFDSMIFVLIKDSCSLFSHQSKTANSKGIKR